MRSNKFILLLSLLSIFISSVVYAAPHSYGSIICDKLTKVYDGDTFYCTIDSWPEIVGDNIGIRVNGIDTPEIRGKSEREKELAIKARDFARNMLRNARVIELRGIKRGKYFRIVADVYADDVSLAQALIDAGLARPYDGGTKIPW